MNLYIDCEWNESQGDLISMALVSEYGQEFYEVVPCLEPMDWVAKNVIPVLDKEPVDILVFRGRLALFLSSFESINVISDWPEDISHFCNALIVGPGQRINTPKLTMQITSIDAESKHPHNALWDARAIRNSLCIHGEQ